MSKATLNQAVKILSVFEDTPNEQIQAILASGFLADLRDGNISKVNRDEFRKFIGLKSLQFQVSQPPEQPIPLLTEIATVEVPAVAKFVAADHFKSGVAGIKFWFGDNFKNNFLDKVEENVPATTLAIHRLNRSSVDGPIRKELGPEREETALAYFYELIKSQPKGEEGKLPTDGTWIIAYIKDDKENLWAVRSYWRSLRREWSLDAYSVGRPLGCSQGSRVLSRK